MVALTGTRFERHAGWTLSTFLVAGPVMAAWSCAVRSSTFLSSELFRVLIASSSRLRSEISWLMITAPAINPSLSTMGAAERRGHGTIFMHRNMSSIFYV